MHPTDVRQRRRAFARHFGRSPARLGPEQVRAYQLHLTNERRLARSTLVVYVSALRFLYRTTLNKRWSFNDLIPLPKRSQSLPVVPSREEVARLLDAVKAVKHRAILTTCYAAGLRISEAVRLTVSAIDSERMVLRVANGKGRKDRYVMPRRSCWRCCRSGGRSSGPATAALGRMNHVFSSPTLNGDVLDDIVVGDKVDHDPDFTPANRLTKVPLHIFVSNGDGTFTHAPELVRLEPPLVYRNNGADSSRCCPESTSSLATTPAGTVRCRSTRTATGRLTSPFQQRPATSM